MQNKRLKDVKFCVLEKQPADISHVALLHSRLGCSYGLTIARLLAWFLGRVRGVENGELPLLTTTHFTIKPQFPLLPGHSSLSMPALSRLVVNKVGSLRVRAGSGGSLMQLTSQPPVSPMRRIFFFTLNRFLLY